MRYIWPVILFAVALILLAVASKEIGNRSHLRSRKITQVFVLLAFAVGFVHWGISSLPQGASATTWFEFAKEILKDKNVAIIPVDSTEFVQKVNRPKYSVMSTGKAQATGFTIPTWQDALARFQGNLNRNSSC